jgi:uncharacterized protein (TIGR03663 family)
MRRPARVTIAVLAVAALALLTRFVGLGARPFHWDEARVGYWTLRSLETGVYEYRPIAGGPFLYLADRVVFGMVGASDFTARAIVALVGGLLPISALLFHEHNRVRRPPATEGRTPSSWRVGLSRTETVSLALLLALTPPLLYYSRFLRGDLPLAAFGLVAFGSFVRAHRTESRGWFYVGALFVGLAATTSALSPAMAACWLVAAALSFDEGRVRRDTSRAIRTRARRIADGVSDRATPLARGLFVVLGVVVLFFAPRGGNASLYNPGTLLAALERATVGAAEAFWGVFVLGRHAPPSHLNDHALLPYVEGLVGTLLATALPVVALAVYGFLLDRYSGRPRPVVAFATYWAGIGVLFFAGATEVNAPWVAVHVLVPLSIPAAVGLASFVDFGRRAVASEEAVPIALTLLLVLAGGVHLGAVLVGDAYAPPDDDSELAQYAQPSADLRPAMADATRAIEGNDGVDVLYVGSAYVVADESTLEAPPVPPGDRQAFSNRLPLAWYFESADAETASVGRPEGLTENPPPVVVTTPALQEDVATRTGSGYQAYEVELGLYDRDVVFFVRTTSASA